MSPMDVDSVNDKIQPIEVHPLAIVNMADQHTRIRCGGSPIAVYAPVQGLLLGPNTTTIRDAEDIPLNDQATMVGLHQAVFADHKVIGWYKAQESSPDPSTEDLNTTMALSKQYELEDFVFALLHVAAEDSDDLPLTLYHCRDGALVAVDDWKLHTDTSEQLAVETVVRDVPQDKSLPPYVRASREWMESLDQMESRIQVLIDFCEATHTGKIPLNHDLIRQVEGVLIQFRTIAGNKPLPDPLADKTVQMAAIGQLVRAVHSHMETCTSIYQNNTWGTTGLGKLGRSAASARTREQRRPFG